MSQTNSSSDTTYPTDGPTEHDPDTFPSEWINYGDVDPVVHGGAWIRRDGGMWQVVANYNLRENGPEGMIRDGEHQMVQTYWFEPQDVWIDGDPDKGFSETFKKSIRGRSREPDHTRDMRYIAQEIALGFPHQFGGNPRDSYTDDLESHLSDRFGIELDDE